jgi:hypothetical protein
MSTGADPSATPAFNDRRGYEQALMRIGRRLQSTGQLLEQDPTRLAAKGFAFDASVTGPRPLQIDLDELRGFFEPDSPANVGRLLQEYQALLAREKQAGG